jgi:alkylation response protein AidB-like acyl-CoA dehydrogenase
VNFAPTEEQLMVKDMVRKFAETEIKPIAAELNQMHRHPEEICRKLGAMGIMGIAVPTEYGGANMDNVTYVMAMIEISKACASCGAIVSVNNTLYGHPVKTFGTHEQKLKYLKPVAGGEVEGCYGLAEEGADSEEVSVRCKAELIGDKYIVNGTKTFVTNGPVARYCVLTATTDPCLGYKGVINLIVDLKETPGFKVGKIEEKPGILAASKSELVFQDAEIPVANLLGKPGQGFQQMVAGIKASRIGIGARACGIGRACLDEAMTYAKECLKLSKLSVTNKMIQFKLANMATELDVAELLLLRAACLEDHGLDFENESAMSKYYALEVALRAAKICQNCEGTNEIQCIAVARKLLG